MNKKRLWAASVLWIFPLVLFANWENKSFEFEGYTREYRVYTPADFSSSRSYSLVLGIHGLGDNMTSFANAFTDFCRIADTADIILVYPQGLSNFLIGTGWNAGAGMLGIYPSEFVDDVAFINALTDTIQAYYPIIREQTYLFGFSNGGFMVQRIACEANDKFAAIASIAGTLGNKINICGPERKIPILHFHGTADINVSYYNPPMGKSVSALLNLWSTNYNCDPETERTDIPDTKPDGYRVEHYKYKNCDSRLEFFKINNAMHVLLNKANNDISYAEEIWRFFRPEEENPVTVGLNTNKQDRIKLYPVPGRDFINIELQSLENHQHLVLSVWDYTGKQIAQLPESQSGRYRFDCSHLSSGVYLISATDGHRYLSARFTVAR